MRAMSVNNAAVGNFKVIMKTSQKKVTRIILFLKNNSETKRKTRGIANREATRLSGLIREKIAIITISIDQISRSRKVTLT